MAAQRVEFHKPPFAVLRIHSECCPDKHRSGNDTETDADPLVDTHHVHDDEHHEQGEQPPAKMNRYWLLSPLNSGLRPIPLLTGYFAMLQEEGA